jgi:hypothetical protein
MIGKNAVPHEILATILALTGTWKLRFNVGSDEVVPKSAYGK